jgi:hypothetical protein
MTLLKRKNRGNRANGSLYCSKFKVSRFLDEPSGKAERKFLPSYKYGSVLTAPSLQVGGNRRMNPEPKVTCHHVAGGLSIEN